MVIKESALNRVLDNVVNSLESFVLKHKSECKNWANMDNLLVIQYYLLVDNVLKSKTFTSLNQLELEDKVIVSNRLVSFLALAKDEYDKN